MRGGQMTDREKKIEFREYLVESIFNLGVFSKYHLSHALDKFDSLFGTNGDYRPSSRPCFDKPAGVPILHGETVE